MVHPRGLSHISFVISAVTTTQCSMKKLEKLSLKKNHANHNFVIYIFVNAQKVVHPRGFNHMSFVISAVTTTQCSMKKLEKLSLKKNLANHTGLVSNVFGKVLPSPPYQTDYTEGLVMLKMNIFRLEGGTSHPQHLS